MSVGTATELWQLSATDLAAAIRVRQASSREVIEAHLRRISEVNRGVNAVPVVLADEALAAASAADRDTAGGRELPPLHGVPFTVKSNIDVAGTPTTQGLNALAGAYPAVDAPSVVRLRAAGAIPIGRSNMPTIAVRWHTESELWGATVNPWDPTRTPGASSGGEAVALATGMSPLGLGSDGLGSLRWPAQCCGVCALKPTLGRIPDASTADGSPATPIGTQLTVVIGPLSRCVTDLRAAFEVIAGPSPRDPWTVPAPLRGPAPDTPIRVALVLDPAGAGVAPQVRAGVRKAARALDAAGYVIDEVEPPGILEAAMTALGMLNTPDIRAVLELRTPGLPPDTQRFLSAFYEAAGDPDPVAVLRSFATRLSLLRSWAEFQQTHPLIVAPICTDIPFEVGTDLDDGRVADTLHGMRMAIAVNALGLPAVAVPVGVADGLPQVVQVIGRRYREDLCLDAAAAVESGVGVFTPIDPR